MLRTIVWFIYFWLYLVKIIPKLIKVKQLHKAGQISEHDEIVYQVVQDWAQSLVKLTGTRVKVTGIENIPQDEAVVFISNHQGNFDIPILLGYIDKPKAFIAKIELLKMPLISTWMKHMKCTFMDRSDIRQSLKTIGTAAEYIREGYSMVIFPEGTRSKGRVMGEFKPGSFKLALKAKAPIVPVTIRGSYKIMEGNLGGFVMKPAEVEVIISQPVSTKDVTKEQEASLPHEIKRIIESHLNP